MNQNGNPKDLNPSGGSDKFSALNAEVGAFSPGRDNLNVVSRPGAFGK